MKNKDSVLMEDKQTGIRNYMQNLLWLKNIIDAHGNILDLDRFRAEVDLAIHNCEVRMARNTTVDCVVIDRELYSVSLGEKEYLESLAKHTKNFNNLKENPITSFEDLPKSHKKVLFPKTRVTWIILKERVNQLLGR